MSKLVEDFINDPYEMSINNLVKLGKKANEAYYNTDSPILTDKQYDLLRSIIEENDPDNDFLNCVGYKSEKNKIKLPYVLGSAKKPSAKILEKFLINFKKKYRGPYVISEKLDGISALLTVDTKMKMMTKGNSETGSDISNLIPFLIKDINKKNIHVRGEIIMSKRKFKKYTNDKNPRNTVAGFINSKTLDKGISDCKFVAYELLKPWTTFENQFKNLSKMGFEVAKHELVDDLTTDSLLELYRKYVNESEFECDGIIVTANDVIRENSKYPDYLFAFKSLDDLETAIVTVKSVIWQVSKDGYLKPVIEIKPVLLGGVSIKRVTSYNANYIYKNNIGPGTKFELVRSGGVIPYIKSIIKSSKTPSMPDCEWEWNFTQIDIIATEYSDEQKIQELKKFFKDINVDNLSTGNIKKLIEANIDTIPKICKITVEKLSKVKNFKDKMVNKIYNNIKSSLDQVLLQDFMVSTNLFGRGIGKKLINKIFKAHPDILFKYIEMNEDDFSNTISDIDDFGEERAVSFTQGMKQFLILLNKLPVELQDRFVTLPEAKTNEIDEKFNNKSFVFSGPRNKEWEKIIEEKGGKVGSSVSSKTFALISTQEEIENETNSKIIKAKAIPIKIFNWTQFEKYIKS